MGIVPSRFYPGSWIGARMDCPESRRPSFDFDRRPRLDRISCSDRPAVLLPAALLLFGPWFLVLCPLLFVLRLSVALNPGLRRIAFAGRRSVWSRAFGRRRFALAGPWSLVPCSLPVVLGRFVVVNADLRRAAFAGRRALWNRASGRREIECFDFRPIDSFDRPTGCFGRLSIDLSDRLGTCPSRRDSKSAPAHCRRLGHRLGRAIDSGLWRIVPCPSLVLCHWSLVPGLCLAGHWNQTICHLVAAASRSIDSGCRRIGCVGRRLERHSYSDPGWIDRPAGRLWLPPICRQCRRIAAGCCLLIDHFAANFRPCLAGHRRTASAHRPSAVCLAAWNRPAAFARLRVAGRGPADCRFV